MTQYNIKTTKPKPYEIIGIELHDGTKTKAYLSKCWEGQYGYRETTSMATYDESDIICWWKIPGNELSYGVLTEDQTDEQ